MLEFPLRRELLHPITVHFPIVLLLMASVLSWLRFLRKDKGPWQSLGWSLLFGVLAAWTAIFTGNWADAEVARTLCDPTVLKQHENLALLLTYLYSAMLGLFGYLHFIRKRTPGRAALLVMTLLGSGGALLLMYTGHLGANLVYEQAAGVSVPSPDCAGF